MIRFENRWNRIGAQIAFWFLILGIVDLMFLGMGAPADFYYRNTFHLACAVVLIFLNVTVFVPRLFSKQRYGSYGLAVFLTLIAVVALAYAFDDLVLEPMKGRRGGLGPGPMPPPPDLRLGIFDPRYFINLILYAAVVLASTVVESVRQGIEQEQRTNRLEQEKLKTEMQFLKSQINPHFLFNMLNNVYSLAITQSEQTSEVVMKLSEMLRYMLYDSNRDRVALDQEVNYIRNYVALQELKDDEPLDVDLAFEAENPQALIAPMILIPFVENAFKHSRIEDSRSGWIRIGIREARHELELEVSNSVPVREITQDVAGGIGLANVSRRLELEYGGRHRLEIFREEQFFRVTLSIDLQ